MATTTPNFGFAVPTSTDYVKDGAVAIETLGDDIDERFGDVTNYPNQIVNRVSSVSRPLPFAMQAGQAAITGSATVTWANATRFTQTPLLQVSVVNGNVNRLKVVASSVTSTSFTLAVYAGGTTLSTTSAAIDYLGIQMTSAASAG
jgi:hypothetical protein